MQAWSSYGLLWTAVHDLLGVTPDMPAHTVSVVPEVPPSRPRLAVSNLHVGTAALAESASRQSGACRTVVTGAQGLAQTIGAVLPAGSAPGTVTLNGAPARYQVVHSTRGTEVQVSVPHPVSQETLTVSTAG